MLLFRAFIFGSGEFGGFDDLDRAIAGEIPDVDFDGLSLVVRRNDPAPVRADRYWAADFFVRGDWNVRYRHLKEAHLPKFERRR